MSELRKEIDYLKGQLAAAQWCISFLFPVALAPADADTKRLARRKVLEADFVAGNDDERRGFDSFKVSLLKHIPYGTHAVAGHDDPPEIGDA